MDEIWNRDRVVVSEVKAIKRTEKPKKRVITLDEFYADVDQASLKAKDKQNNNSGSKETLSSQDSVDSSSETNSESDSFYSTDSESN